MIQKIAIIAIAVLLVSCSTVSATPTQLPASPTPIKPTSTSEAVSTPTVVEVPQQERPTETNVPIARYNFLLLGGDFRAHRRGTAHGNKDDVMLLVSILMDDPIQFSVIQFPRNFYTPVENFPDMWLFAVYGREDFVGLHYYFQEVFDVDLQAVAHINMDKFQEFVDNIGGVWIDGRAYTGEALLKYLRDNTNNWQCPEYDCEDRQFKTLMALAEKIKTQFGEHPLATAEKLWKAYRHLFETDISEFEQFHWLVELGWFVATSDYEIAFEKLTESGYVEYGETPLNVRGWIAADDLHEWSRAILGGSYGR